MFPKKFLFFPLVFGIICVSNSSRATNQLGDDTQLERRGLLANLIGPNSLLSSPEGILGAPATSGSNLASLPRGPPPEYIPGDAPWTLSEAAYRSMITCPGGLRGQRGVVLLLPPTGGNGRQTWLKSPYVQGLSGYGFSTCWVDNPTRSTGDQQLTAEFVAYAIKYLASQTGAPVSIITFSQGGINGQWTLTFWPSARRLVRNMITLASPFHGTVTANALCASSQAIGGCLPGIYQMETNSRYIAALNAPVVGSGATALVPTTSIYSLQDEIVPQVGRFPTSALPGAVNIVLQQICGVSYVADHFLMPGDLTAYAIAVNALLSGGAANAATLSPSICNQAGSLGYQVGGLANDLKYAFASIVGNPGERIGSLLRAVTTLRVPSEPPLQMYVCQRGFATGCSANGFSGPQGSAPILSSLPQTIQGLVPLGRNILGGLGGGRII